MRPKRSKTAWRRHRLRETDRSTWDRSLSREQRLRQAFISLFDCKSSGTSSMAPRGQHSPLPGRRLYSPPPLAWKDKRLSFPYNRSARLKRELGIDCQVVPDPYPVFQQRHGPAEGNLNAAMESAGHRERRQTSNKCPGHDAHFRQPSSSSQETARHRATWMQQ